MPTYNYINSTGVISPDTSELRAQVESEFRAAFGQDIDLSPETPQGVLVTMEVENRDALVRNNAELANQINPDIAGGIFLDAIWRFMDGERFGPVHSYLHGVLFAGVPLTIIPRGSLAETQSGDFFETTSVIIIGSDGTAIGDMRSVEAGAVVCLAGELTKVASSVLGWETVINPNAAVLGRASESDVQARRRRRNTLALNTISVSEAITGSLHAIDGVRSLAFRENITDEPIVIDGINLKPHSIYVCVEGGDQEDIAKALLRTKTVGSGYNGNITVLVTDEYSGQEYQVQFDRPENITLFCRVTVRSSALDAQTIIPDAIEKWEDGEIEGDAGLFVGSDASPFEISAAINFVEPQLFITKVELSTDGNTWSTDTAEMKINQVARISKSSVQVVIV